MQYAQVPENNYKHIGYALPKCHTDNRLVLIRGFRLVSFGLLPQSEIFLPEK